MDYTISYRQERVITIIPVYHRKTMIRKKKKKKKKIATHTQSDYTISKQYIASPPIQRQRNY